MLALVAGRVHCYDPRALPNRRQRDACLSSLGFVIMRGTSCPPTLLWLVVCLAATGCGRVVFTPQGAQQGGQPVTLTPQQQQTLAAQQHELQQRADALDRDNQELEALLAQTRQQMQLMRDQVVATQDQLKATPERLAATQKENQQLQNRTQALTASTQQPAGAEIRANNTLLRHLNLGNVPGVEVRQDGDTIRIRMAGDDLFEPGTARLRRDAEQTIRTVAAEVLGADPEHLIGIEGHTDNRTGMSQQYPSPHHLSVAQATAVYELLRQSLQVPSEQLFLIGHGGNHPLVSNETTAGQAQNRRIELVVYPETVRRR